MWQGNTGDKVIHSVTSLKKFIEKVMFVWRLDRVCEEQRKILLQDVGIHKCLQM